MNLEWLTTAGGKILVTVLMLIFITAVCVAMSVTGHPLQEGGKELATAAISSLLTILYRYLGSEGK